MDISIYIYNYIYNWTKNWKIKSIAKNRIIWVRIPETKKRKYYSFPFSLHKTLQALSLPFSLSSASPTRMLYGGRSLSEKGGEGQGIEWLREIKEWRAGRGGKGNLTGCIVIYWKKKSFENLSFTSLHSNWTSNWRIWYIAFNDWTFYVWKLRSSWWKKH